MLGEINAIQKYRKRIGVIEEGKKTLKIGKGIYTQAKRNAQKINKNGQYGDLTIDVPKFYGKLWLVAYHDKKKIYDKQVDFDTIDLLTNWFNSKKI